MSSRSKPLVAHLFYPAPFRVGDLGKSRTVEFSAGKGQSKSFSSILATRIRDYQSVDIPGAQGKGGGWGVGRDGGDEFWPKLLCGLIGA